MPKVIIDGIEYVPREHIEVRIMPKPVRECLKSLTEIQYFSDQTHKHRAWAWDALNAIAPSLAKLEPEEAYRRIHGDD